MAQAIGYPGHDLLAADIVRAENSYLYDSNDRRYVDLEAGIWCMSIGHGHPRVQQALIDQSTRIMHTGYSYTDPVVAQAAQELLALTKMDGGASVFLTSGSEAVEYAVRVARQVIDDPLMMILADSYCGAYGSAYQKSPDAWHSLDWTVCANCRVNGDCSEQCAIWAAIPFVDIGGFLFEPGSSGGMVRFPPKKLIRGIVRQIRANNGLVLVNEVTTGMGRTGQWFGYQHYGITPDIVALGKGIGNGYPVSATAVSPGVVDRLNGASVPYAQSHMNDPLGAAIVMAVIHAIRDEGLVVKCREKGEILRSGLDSIRDRADGIVAVRSRGLMVAIDILDEIGAPRTRQIHRALFDRGYIVAKRPSLNVLRLDPSLTISIEDIMGFLAALKAVLTEPLE